MTLVLDVAELLLGHGAGDLKLERFFVGRGFQKSIESVVPDLLLVEERGPLLCRRESQRLGSLGIVILLIRATIGQGGPRRCSRRSHHIIVLFLGRWRTTIDP